MNRITRLMTEHPASVNETYFQHMGVAFSFGLRMTGAGLASLVHGVFPFLCTRTGSQAITELHDKMVAHRTHAPKEATSRAVPEATPAE